jgi:hypothetical protein
MRVKPGEGHRLRMFKNTIQWKMFRSKKEEISGWWRKVFNEELCNLYFS